MSSSSITASPDITIATTAPRVTPAPARTHFKDVLKQTVVGSAEQAMKLLPGSPLMAVAIRGVTGGQSALGVPVTGTGSIGTSRAALTSSAEGPSVSSTSTIGAGTGAAGSGDSTIDASLQQGQEQSLQFLKLQADMNAQERQFTALSNIMKSEHDTMKTAIGNIR